MKDSTSNFGYKSRSLQKGFMASDCAGPNIANFYPIYANSIDPLSTKCNVVLNETVLMYSHDDSKVLSSLQTTSFSLI